MSSRPAPGGRFRVVDGEAGPASLSDAELAVAVARGDQRVAGEFYDRLLPVVDRTLFRVFGRREPEHDDLIQATFEQIVFTLVKRRYAGACGLKTWASTLASHVGLKALRSRVRERRVLSDAQPDEPTSHKISCQGERSVSVRCDIERLRSHLARMKPERAEAVFLHDVLGHDLAEIALMTRCSIAAAQSRLSRGRRELAQRMCEEEQVA